MKVSLFFILCALIPSILTQCTVDRAKPFFRRSVYEFSLKLLNRVAQEKDNHFVTSTLSTWILLSCASLGAEDTTLAEMKQVLKLHANKCFNYKYLEIASTLSSNDEAGVLLEKSSTIFADDKLRITEDFRSRLQNTGVASIETLPFENTESAALNINEFVSRATHDSIDEVVTATDLEDVLLVMIDAIYFKGSWNTQFPSVETELSAFYNERGVQIGDVNLMYVSSSFNMRHIEQIKASVLELPYGNGDRYSMLIFLPTSGVPLYQVIDNLRHVSLATIKFLFNEFGPQQVSVQIPRFKISSDLNNLKELMADMGLKAMFDSAQAQFPYICDYPLYVSNFIQKADIEVTEEGTTASAATVLGMGFRTLPEKFTANRPFLFMIVDKSVEVPIFTGAYSKPSIY